MPHRVRSLIVTVAAFAASAIGPFGVGCSFPSYEFLPCEPGTPACARGEDASPDDRDADVSEDGSASDAEADAPVNLVDSPGCESGVGNWHGFQARVACDLAVHRLGNASFVVTRDAGVTDYYTFDRSGPFVSNPPAGRSYTATAWVRSSLASGLPVAFILRQQGGSSAATESMGPSVNLSGEWQAITTSITIDAPDRTELTGHIVRAQPFGAAGDAFNVDDVSVVSR